jgi:glutathione S-transferase
VPVDPEFACRTRLQDRFYDLYVNVPMQKIVTDKLRPPGKNDPHGVEEAKKLLQTACALIEREMAARTWAMGDDFSMADCAAAPALFYANMVTPLGDTYPRATAYLGRLMDRPSYARALKEAKPYLALVPK